MAPYSMDLRERVVRAWDASGDAEKVAGDVRGQPGVCPPVGAAPPRNRLDRVADYPSREELRK